jgi:L-alanine-DL-glutamate epimerase-like enolase superfamily enzyme
VIMPDVKHVGGFGPLLQACRMAASYHVEVSPHNPSGLVSTLASLHAGAISPSATSLEVAWPSSSHQPRYNILQEGEYLKLPEGSGWGLEVDEIFKVQEGYL